MSVVITGCSVGIGHATAIEFAKRGYKVIAGARRLELMKDLETDYGIKIIKLDVTSTEDIAELKKLIETEYNGEVKYLYNNAGQSCTFPAVDVKDEDVFQCYDVNVFGAIRMTRALIPYIIKTKGTIGFTGSLSGLHPVPFSSIYSSSKAAIHLFASVLGFELEPMDVKVINIITGAVKTDIADERPLYPDSIYQVDGMEEVIAKRRIMAKTSKPISPEAYAKKVVTDFENSKIGKINYCRGSFASFMYWVQYLPRFIPINIFKRRFQMDHLFKVLKEKYSKSIT